jgi:hypothetical protein
MAAFKNSNDPSTSSPFPSLEHAAYSRKKKIVGGESIWSVSQTAVGDHAEFAGDAFWWFTLWSSEGNVDMSR